MDWNKGFSAKYYANIVDSVAWQDADRIEIVSGKISRSDSDLRQNAEIDCINYDNSKEQWVRIYLDARQENDSVHVPLFTGITSCPNQNIDGVLVQSPVQCFSVLKPTQDVLLPRGWYATAGTSIATLIKELLAPTPAPFAVAGIAPQLRGYIIAEENESNLSMINKILVASGWRLNLHGDGTIQLCESSKSSIARFDSLNNDVIEPQLKVSEDWYSCPNVLRAISEQGESVIVRDDSPNSKLSTVNRGREVWAEESSCEFNAGENIRDYALRRLKELQQHGFSVSYDRRFHPDVIVGELVDISYPAQNITGTFRIVSQSIDLGYGAKTYEEVVKI